MAAGTPSNRRQSSERGRALSVSSCDGAVSGLDTAGLMGERLHEDMVVILRCKGMIIESMNQRFECW